ncbi:MAG: hypothetical protein H6726_14480 [Sandaracinaceae bacterium]|nr:hypothetical protein [Sandaracinaceae bacterium]
MRRVAIFAFFLSGASSLIFQSIWSRLAHHVFGATSVAISTVVTAFMAGLGLGAFIAGRYADKLRNPLRAYALVELGVGAYALLLPTILDPEGWLAVVNASLRASLGAESTAFMFARFFCVFPFILIPTTLMGSSLPLLARHFVRSDQDASAVASWVGVLYAVNTVGAVFGTALSVFGLMPTIGLWATGITAAGMNFALAGLIFLTQRMGWDQAPRLDASPEEDDDREALARVPRYARRAAVFAFFVSGAAALCYEVVWSRALAMTNGSSVQGFGIILTTFLVGIAGGSAAASGLLTQARRRLDVTASVSIALVMYAVTPFALFDQALVRGVNAGSLAVPAGLLSWVLLSLLGAAPVVVLRWLAALGRTAETPRERATRLDRLALLTLTVPLAFAIVGAVLHRGPSYGQYPQIVATVVVCVAVLVVALITLRSLPVLQLAVMQLLIALATLANLVFQDEVSCALGALVAGIEDLPDHVATVRFFSFLTSSLCTLPATLGMGAMFPLTLRLFAESGATIGDDVGRVYSSNTLGSIIGAWVPGFILMPRFGMQAALFAGMALNFAMALMLLVVAAADPEEPIEDPAEDPEGDAGRDPDPEGPPDPAVQPDGNHAATREAPPARAGGPHSGRAVLESIVIYALAPVIPALLALVYFGIFRPNSPWFVPDLTWDPGRMTLGVFRPSVARQACRELANTHVELLYYHDGLSTTVTVERYWGTHLAMKNNGKVDASNGEDMPTQINLAAYPLMMHERGPEGLDVAVIGFGSGVTVGTALHFPVRSVDVIELERAIPEAARWFTQYNHLEFPLEEFPYVQMDRLEVINDDGRNYLAATEREYDVIISEPSNPWITGVADLFTEEHFRISKRRLREGGIYCQWVQLYELSPENIKTIYRTFASQFAHVVAFSADDFSPDTVLLGSDSPLPLDLERVARGFAVESARQDLLAGTLHRPHDVFSRVLLADRDEVQQFTQVEYVRDTESSPWVQHNDSDNARPCALPLCRREPVPTNTDDNMLIEFAAPRDLIGYERYERYLPDHLYAPTWPYGNVVGRVVGLGEGSVEAANLAELSLALLSAGRRGEASSLAELSVQAGRASESLVAIEVMRRLLGPEGEPPIRVSPPSGGPELSPRQARVLNEGFLAVRDAVDRGDYGAALNAMEDIPAPVRQHSGPSMKLLYAYLLYKTGAVRPRYDEVVTLLEELSGTHPRWVAERPEVKYFMARAMWAEAAFGDAVRVMRQYVERLLLDEAAARDERERAREEGPAGPNGQDAPDSPSAQGAPSGPIPSPDGQPAPP